MGNNTETPKLCIHCGDTNTPCPYRDGIMCRGYICARDDMGTKGGMGGDYSKVLGKMFGGFGK